MVSDADESFRLLADFAPVLMWMSDTDKQCTFFNRGWLDFTGRPLQQELGDGWTQGVHPDDLGRCLRTYVDAFDIRRPFEMEYRLRRHDGQYRWVIDKGGPRFASDGTFLGYIGSAYDVTELRQSDERRRQILEAAPNGFIVVTNEGRIAYVNAVADAIFGYADGELIGQPIELLVPERFHVQPAD